MMRTLLFRVLCLDPLFSETPRIDDLKLRVRVAEVDVRVNLETQTLI